MTFSVCLSFCMLVILSFCTNPFAYIHIPNPPLYGPLGMWPNIPTFSPSRTSLTKQLITPILTPNLCYYGRCSSLFNAFITKLTVGICREPKYCLAVKTICCVELKNFTLTRRKKKSQKVKRKLNI